MCSLCMARWVRKLSDEYDAISEFLSATSSASTLAGPSGPHTVAGFMDLMAAARVNASLGSKLMDDALAFGAVHVSELTESDWQLLPSWRRLRPLEWRRLRAALPPTCT